MTKAMTEDTAPAITGIHHLSVTVRDIEASVAWYQRLFRAERVPMKLPHYEREDKPVMVCCSSSRARDWRLGCTRTPETTARNSTRPARGWTT